MADLTLKLIIMPVLISTATLVSKIWGPVAGGWLIGLPLTSGPTVFFLAREQGTPFASHVAVGILSGGFNVILFCLVYAWLSVRFEWPPAMLGSWLALSLSTLVLQTLRMSLVPVFLLLVASIALIHWAMPKAIHTVAPLQLPWWDIPLKILIATGFIIIVTASAPYLGSFLSGVIATFPIYASILAAFNHRLQGSPASIQFLKGVVTSQYAFAVCFLLITLLIIPLGIATSFLVALIAIIVTQGLVMWRYHPSPI